MQAITVQDSRQVIVNDISMVDSQQIHINFHRVNGGHANNVTINAPWSSPNTDGIHIQGTTNFVIQNCHVSTGLHLYPSSFPPTNYMLLYNVSTPKGPRGPFWASRCHYVRETLDHWISWYSQLDMSKLTLSKNYAIYHIYAFVWTKTYVYAKQIILR